MMKGEVDMGGGNRWPITKFQGMPAFKAITGHVEAMALYAGQSVGDVREVQPSAEIVGELVGRRTSSGATA
jgi:nitronate monooxygenase